MRWKRIILLVIAAAAAAFLARHLLQTPTAENRSEARASRPAPAPPEESPFAQAEAPQRAQPKSPASQPKPAAEAVDVAQAAAIYGRVVDERGAPLSKWTVNLQSDPNDKARSTFTAANGDFEMGNLPPSPHTIKVYERKARSLDPVVTVDGVRPSRERITIIAPDKDRAQSSVRGKIVSSDGAPVAGLTVGVVPSPQFTLTSKTDDAGVFAVETLKAGDYYVSIKDPRFAPYESERRALRPRETWDLGTVTLGKGAALTVRLSAVAGVSATNANIMIAQKSAGGGVDWSRVKAECAAGAAERVFAGLAPGDYYVWANRIPDPATAPAKLVSVGAGEAEVNLLLVRATSGVLEIAAEKEQERLVGHCAFVVYDASNAVVWAAPPSSRWRPPCEFAIVLPDQLCRYEILVDSTAHSSGSFRLEGGASGAKVKVRF